MNGGYIMIKASDADIYASASRALNIGKPILFYENDTTCYYIDTITLDGTNIVLTKGGKTITIANDNTITSSGDIVNPLMENIKDANGHLRFIEGDGTTIEVTGVSISYNKWSLSGTHLMLVLAGTIADTTVLNNTDLASYEIPEWIMNKIYPIASNRINIASFNMYADDLGIQTMTGVKLIKSTNTIDVRSGSVTLTANRNFRIQFDLLIDNE